MFNLSMGEIGIIATVALVVLGPDKLPQVAKTAGSLMGKAQRLVSQVKSDINKEVELSELKKIQEDAKKMATDLEEDLRKTQEGIEHDVEAFNKSVNQTAEEIENKFNDTGKAAEETIQTPELGATEAKPEDILNSAQSEVAAKTEPESEVKESESDWGIGANDVDTSDLDSAFVWNEEPQNQPEKTADVGELAKEVERLRSLVEANNLPPKSNRRYATRRSLRGNFVMSKPMPRRARNV